MKGPVWVNPSDVQAIRMVPEVVIEQVWVDGKLINPEASPGPQPGTLHWARGSPPALFSTPSSLRVSPGRHYLDFRFVGISLTSPEKVRYRCRMEGVDNDWRDIGKNRDAAYNGLPPGDFVLNLQACDEDNLWSPHGAKLSLTALPHFWQTWWFKGLLGLFVVAALWGAHAIRAARVREIERLRLRIARDLHDEVGAGLGTIALLGELIEGDYGAKDGTKVRQLALQTIDALRDIIWFIDPTFDRLNDLVQRIELVAKTMLPGLELQFLPVGQFDSCHLPLAFRRNLIPLVKESLRNITRHSKATRVEISVQRQKGSFQLQIVDNGIGFDAASPAPGSGLKNIRQRAAAMRGRVQVRSSPGAGTHLTLTAPIP